MTDETVNAEKAVKKKITLRLTEEQMALLQQLSESSGKKPGRIVRSFVARGLKREAKRAEEAAGAEPV